MHYMTVVSLEKSDEPNLTPTEERNSYMKQHFFDAFKAKGVRQVLTCSRFSVHLSMGATTVLKSASSVKD